jgi:hypothetical protein
VVTPLGTPQHTRLTNQSSLHQKEDWFLFLLNVNLFQWTPVVRKEYSI